jgi:trans-2,3-dihydro-3-hydroxyanthranilate isomerase
MRYRVGFTSVLRRCRKSARVRDIDRPVILVNAVVSDAESEFPMTDYLVYDVFTDRPFSGNALAVVTDAGALPEDRLQSIAREFNFSETVFVFPPADPANTARLRIFTPARELPFAGHPTIGTAIALSDLGRAANDMVLELGVGPISCHAANGHARFETRVPLETWDGPSADVVGACIGQSADVVRCDRHAPVIASVGMPFAIAELAGPAALTTASPVIEAFRAYELQWPADTHFDLLVYLRDGDEIRARMFAPLDGIPEDPATGGAAAALAAYLGRLDGRSGSFTITQGVEMGRESRIEASVTVENGVPVAVSIAGSAVRVMEGRLVI